MACPKYYAFVKTLPCIICGLKSDPHHLTAVGIGGGTGEDLTCVNLCRKHHTIAHTMSVKDFNAEFNIDLWRECHRTLMLFMKQQPGFTVENNVTSLKLVVNRA
jgi:hypothetical protein